MLAPAPASALPIVDDLLPSIPGPSDIAQEFIQYILKTFFGISAEVTTRVVEFLVAHPIYTDAHKYPDLAHLRSYISSGAWGLLTLVIAASGLHYWAAGFTSASSYQALAALGRSIAAIGALVAYPKLFEYTLVASNMLTHDLLHAPGVQEGLTKVLGAALVLNVASLGIGAIASVAAVIALIVLAITKIVISTILGLLFISAPLAIVLWPVPGLAWLARSWLQAFVAIVLWPIVWALCFALFAVMGNEAFNLHGSFGDKLIKPWVTVAALIAAFKVPQVLARQAMQAGLTPAVGQWAGRQAMQVNAVSRLGGGMGGGGGGGGGGAAAAAESAATTAAAA